MKIVRYVTVRPGQDPETVSFDRIVAASTEGSLPSGWKRYKVSFEVPDPEPAVDATVEDIEVVEED